MSFYYSIEKAAYYFITPTGMSAEFSGIGLFAGKILSWAPLLSFFLFYESTGSMQYGLGFMAVFLLIGAFIILSIDITKAREQALTVHAETGMHKTKTIPTSAVVVGGGGGVEMVTITETGK
jgi:hypothetical protein